MMDVPGVLMAVAADKSISYIHYEHDWKIYYTEMNVLIKSERIQLKNDQEAENHLKNLFNIYGIYEADIACKKEETHKQYKCQIQKTAPRVLKEDVLLSDDGAILTEKS